MKLKTFAALASLTGIFIFQSEAQSNLSPVIATNWVTAVPYFREVNGQLYNTERSVLWTNFQGDILKVLTDEIVVSTFTMEPVYKTEPVKIPIYNNLGVTTGYRLVRTQVQTGEKKVRGRKIVLSHYPANLAPAVGQTVSFRAMRVGTSIYKGDVLELWDYGTPHVMMVVSTNSGPPAAKTVTAGVTNSIAFGGLLNEDQRLVMQWTRNHSGRFSDTRTFDGWSSEERANLERRLIDALKGPQTDEYYQAINTLGALHSTKALPALREIAFDHREKNNRGRWMAIRTLGAIGDKQSVPELIHLLYHYNGDARWWAQIALVQLTGQNFGGDWNAWGNWWNAQKGRPPFDPKIVRWSDSQPEPDKLAEKLGEKDRIFLARLKSHGASPVGGQLIFEPVAERPLMVAGVF